MSSSPIPIEQLARDVDAVGEALESGSFAEVLRGQARDEVLEGIGENFGRSAGPDGTAWPARQILGDGHPLLIQRGDLLAAAVGQGAGHTTEVTDRELVVGVDLVHAATHNYGRPSANIPQRHFMGASEARLDAVGEIIAARGGELIEGRA